jgi:hypothetical protein
MAELKIAIRELPARPRTLAPDELGAVYGGCLSNGTICEGDKDCCSQKCGPDTINTFMFGTKEICSS